MDPHFWQKLCRLWSCPLPGHTHDYHTRESHLKHEHDLWPSLYPTSYFLNSDIIVSPSSCPSIPLPILSYFPPSLLPSFLPLRPPSGTSLLHLGPSHHLPSFLPLSLVQALKVGILELTDVVSRQQKELNLQWVTVLCVRCVCVCACVCVCVTSVCVWVFLWSAVPLNPPSLSRSMLALLNPISGLWSHPHHPHWQMLTSFIYFASILSMVMIPRGHNFTPSKPNVGIETYHLGTEWGNTNTYHRVG